MRTVLKTRSVSLFVLAALIAVFGLLAISCDDGGNGESAYLGTTTLTLSGQVWTVNWADGTSREFNGNRTVTSNRLGGSGAITNGQLNFTIDTPSSLESIERSFSYWLERHTDLNISNPSARMALLGLYTGTQAYLDRGWVSVSDTQEVHELVIYIYVDRDVSITGTGTTSGAYTSTNFNLNLREGWNVFYEKHEGRLSGEQWNWTISYSLNNPSHLRWLLDEGGYSGNINTYSEANKNPARSFFRR